MKVFTYNTIEDLNLINLNFLQNSSVEYLPNERNLIVKSDDEKSRIIFVDVYYLNIGNYTDKIEFSINRECVNWLYNKSLDFYCDLLKEENIDELIGIKFMCNKIIDIVCKYIICEEAGK